MSGLRQRRPTVKDSGHLEFIRELPCCVCGDNTSTEPAHLRSSSIKYGKDLTGGGRKPSDIWVNPLCRRCHDGQHGTNELRWWRDKGINPFTLALTLGYVSGDHEMACKAIDEHRSEYDF